MPTPDAAVALVVPVVIPLLVFAGFFINAKYVREREVKNHTAQSLVFQDNTELARLDQVSIMAVLHQ